MLDPFLIHPKIHYQLQQLPLHQFKCICDLCKNHQYNQFNRIRTLKQKKTTIKMETQFKNINSTYKNDYLWIIRKLRLPKNKIVTRGIEIYIPEICFYKDGQPLSLFMNKQIMDFTLKEIPKQKLGNTFIQKTFNQRRRKYRQKILNLNRSVIINNNKKAISYLNKDETKIDMKDAVVIKKVDGEQLVTQNEFINLMARRRQDQIWNRIISVKNYIPIKQQLKDCVVIKYDCRKNINQQLFQRARTLMKVYGTNILPDEKNYINQQQQKKFSHQLSESDHQKLFIYLTYQIVHFISFFHDIKILKCSFNYILDQIKRPILNYCSKLYYQQQIKYDWTNQINQQKMKSIQDKIFYSQQLPLLSENSIILSNKIKQIMNLQYQGLKSQYGLSLKVVQNTQDEENNAFFKKMHPQCNINLTEILIKDLQIDDFKKKYLGWKKQKKSIIPQFKSGMVKTLHNLTPIKKYYSHSINKTQTLNLNINSPPPQKKHRTRNTSTRGSFNKTSMATKLDQNQSLNLYDF